MIYKRFNAAWRRFENSIQTLKVFNTFRVHALLELAVVAGAAPLLLFPTVRPIWSTFALGELALVWLLAWAVTRRPWPATPLNAPLLALAVMVALAILISDWPELSLPKATGLILGWAVLRVTLLAVRGRRSLGAAVAVFCLVGLVIIVVGAAAAQWVAKSPWLGSLAQCIPRLVTELPGMPAAGVNANELAGVLVLYLPPSAAFVVLAWHKFPGPSARGALFRFVLILGSLSFLTLVAITLALTQSRGGWLGAAAGLLAMGALGGLSDRRPAVRWLSLALPLLLVVLVVGGVSSVGPRRAGELVFGAENGLLSETMLDSASMAGRLKIWDRAFHVIQDYAYTGCGLGAFRKLVPLRYPLFPLHPEADIAHAHNIFLQTALDVGLPGLAAYMALLAAAGSLCWRWSRQGTGIVRGTALGVAGGLVGLHVYGLTDALALGSKPALAFWMALGLVAALEQVEGRHTPLGVGERVL